MRGEIIGYIEEGAVDGWVPWGSAPKDTPILVWLGDPYHCVDIIEWNDALGCWAWKESMGCPGDGVPTHWMLLPKKPIDLDKCDRTAV